MADFFSQEEKEKKKKSVFHLPFIRSTLRVSSKADIRPNPKVNQKHFDFNNPQKSERMNKMIDF